MLTDSHRTEQNINTVTPTPKSHTNVFELCLWNLLIPALLYDAQHQPCLPNLMNMQLFGGVAMNSACSVSTANSCFCMITFLMELLKQYFIWMTLPIHVYFTNWVKTHVSIQCFNFLIYSYKVMGSASYALFMSHLPIMVCYVLH